MGMLAVAASAAPVDMSDANIFTVARLYSWGSHDNGDGPELAHCSITSADYIAYHDDLSATYHDQGVNLFEYTEYPATKDFVLASGNDESKAEDIFTQLCTKHKGAPLRFN